MTPECVPRRAFNKPLPLDALVPQFHSAVSYDRLHLKRSSQKELGKVVVDFDLWLNTMNEYYRWLKFLAQHVISDRSNSCVEGMLSHSRDVRVHRNSTMTFRLTKLVSLSNILTCPLEVSWRCPDAAIPCNCPKVISKIVQAPGKIVVCSAVIAGNADYSDDES